MLKSITNVIEAMYRYEEFSDINNREDTIIENVLKNAKNARYIISWTCLLVVAKDI